MLPNQPQPITATRSQLSAAQCLTFTRFHLLLIEEGLCHLTTPQGVLCAAAGDALLLQPDTSYGLSPQERALLVDIAFTREAFLQSCLPALEGCQLVVSFFVHDAEHSDMTYLHFAKTPPAIHDIADRMVLEALEQEIHYQQVLLLSLTSLLLRLNRTCRVDASATQAPGTQLLQQVMSYLVSHYRDATLESLAAAFHYHPNTIAAVLKKGTGKTFSQLLLQTRMSHAAQLLAHTGLTADEVAQQCGYSNISYFYSRFHRYYGMTPGEYALRARREAGQAQSAAM